MNVIDTAKHQIAGLVRNVVGGDGTPHGGAGQTVTIACTLVEAEDFWRDPRMLSTVLGDVGEVTFSAPDTYRWRLRGDDEFSWESSLTSEPGRLRFADGSGNEIAVSFSPAPAGLGTEVRLSARLPIPGIIAGATAFTLLYRARAVLQTGEAATITRNPSGRETLSGERRGTMRALCWKGVNDLAVESVDEPVILNPHDVIVRVRLSTTCGSDLHFIDGYIPGMREGDVFGHEFMGEIVEVGADVDERRVGDRVVVPSFVACNRCWYCDHELYSCCDTTNPSAALQQPLLGYPSGGIYGYTHIFGGYAGSHAEYIRIPFGDVNCFPVPDDVTDEQALFLSDAAPTGFMGAEFCDLSGGDTVAVFGAGGVGLMAARSAMLLGAERAIVIDRIPERLALAREGFGLETIDYTSTDSVYETLREMTGGRGPDACIDAVGMEGHGTGMQQLYDRAKQLLRMETDRASALREAIMACRKGGVVAVLGIYGVTDKFPMGIVTNKGLTLKSAQQHGQRYMARLFDYVQQGDLDPAKLITHDLPLEQGVRAYDLFKNKDDGCIRVALRP